MTDPLGQSQVLPYLMGLSQLGHSIHLISFEKPDAFIKNKSIVEDLVQNAGITWHPQTYTKKPPVFSTLKDLYVLNKQCKKLHQKYKFDFLHCRSYITSLVALQLKKKYGVPFVFDMRGFWADERVEGKIWNPKNLIFKYIYDFFKKKELRFLNDSKRIVSLTHFAKTEIESWANYKITNAKDKIVVIPCCADLNHFNIQTDFQIGKKRTELGFKPSDLIISYVGSLGTWYMADEMIQLFATIKKTKSNAKLLLITTHKIEEVEPFLEKNNIPLTDVVITAGKRAEMPLLISCSNISMFFVRPTFSKKASSPTKMGEIMGCGIPLICNSGVGDVEQIVEDTNCGICITDFSQIQISRVCNKLDELLLINKESLRDGALKYYSLKEGIRLYNEIYTNMLN